MITQNLQESKGNTSMGKARRAYGSGSIYQRSRDGRWVAVIQLGWTPRGTRKKLELTAKTEAEAKRKLRDKQRQLAADPGATLGSRDSVKTWCEVWLERHLKNVRPATATTDAGFVHKWVIPTIGHKQISTITAADVRAVGDAAEAGGLSPSSVRAAMSITQRIIKSAWREGYPINQRAFSGDLPKAAPTDRDRIPVPDVVRILEYARSSPQGVTWHIALLQGMRQSERLGLTWDAVDLDAGVFDIAWQLQQLPWAGAARTVPRIPDAHESRHLDGAWHLTRPKTTRGTRIVPMAPWLVGELRAYREVWEPNEWGLLFSVPDGRAGRGGRRPRSASADRRDWYTIQEHLGIRHPSGRAYSVHEARHSAAMMLLEGGVDTETVKAILGHSSIASTRRYLHASQDLGRSAVSRVSDMLGLPGAATH